MWQADVTSHGLPFTPRVISFEDVLLVPISEEKEMNRDEQLTELRQHVCTFGVTSASLKTAHTLLDQVSTQDTQHHHPPPPSPPPHPCTQFLNIIIHRLHECSQKPAPKEFTHKSTFHSGHLHKPTFRSHKIKQHVSLYTQAEKLSNLLKHCTDVQSLYQRTFTKTSTDCKCIHWSG